MTPTPSDLAADARLRPIAGRIALMGLASSVTAVTDSLSVAGIAALFAGSVSDASTGLSGVRFEWVSNPWVVLTFVVATFLLNFANSALREHVIATWEARRRADLVRAYRDADFATQTSFAGSKLAVAAEQVTEAGKLIDSMSGLLNTGIRAAVYLIVAFVVLPIVSAVAIGVGAVLIIGLRLLTRRTRRAHRRMAADRTAIGEQIGEMTTSTRELHLLARWDDVVGGLQRRIDAVRHDRFVSGTLATMVGPIYWAGTLGVGLILALVVKHTDSDLRGLAASGLLLIRALGAAQAAQVMYQGYNDATPYFERTLDVIGTLRAARRRSADGTAGPEPTLRLDHVTLGYGQDDVVSDLSATFDRTGGVAIVGPSGSGKSTTLQALSGFLVPTAGTVTADGVPLHLLPGDELGRTVGFLPQDPRLLRATLRANLLRPDTEADDAALLDVIDAVGLTETVNGFDQGLDAEMGRGGEGLSGGELQRLGLARLMVNRPRVWLLDEPTSALDRTNSDRVVDIIRHEMAERLVVLVTHRPDLLARCGRVLVVDAGAVVDDGPLAEVAERHPFVAAMLDAESH